MNERGSKWKNRAPFFPEWVSLEVPNKKHENHKKNLQEGAWVVGDVSLYQEDLVSVKT